MSPHRRRFRSGVIFWARVVLIGQLVIGTLVVRLLAQRPIEEVVAVGNQALNDRASAIELRVMQLENLHIGERLAVLDTIEKDSHEQKLLAYGTMVALLGNLALGIVERRSKPRL